jgi:hypothetical protein
MDEFEAPAGVARVADESNETKRSAARLFRPQVWSGMRRHFGIASSASCTKVGLEEETMLSSVVGIWISYGDVTEEKDLSRCERMSKMWFRNVDVDKEGWSRDGGKKDWKKTAVAGW